MKTRLVDLGPARASLALVWLLTAAVSLIEIHGSSRELLRGAGIDDPQLADTLTCLGAGLDLLLGLALWFRPTRHVCWLAGLSVLGFTVLASFMTPAQWLHPFGPLLKNLPILALLQILARQAESSK